MKVSEIFWNLIAPVYNMLRHNPISGHFLKMEYQAIEELFENLSIHKLKTTCDLGVGRGHSLYLIPEIIPFRIAVDRSLPMIHFTRKQYPGTHFVNANVLNIPLKEASFDLILCIGLVEYIQDLESLFSQIGAILKKGGYLLLSYSPKNICTFFRFIRGHRIYPRDWEEIEKSFLKFHFKLTESKITPLQHQCLLKKN